MNLSILDKNWPELKTEIRNKWGKLSDQELNMLKSDFTLLRGKIQKAYGLSQDHAEFQYEEFKTAYFALIGGYPGMPAAAETAKPEDPDPAKSSQAV